MPRTLLVYPNPYGGRGDALDAEGRPAGAVMHAYTEAPTFTVNANGIGGSLSTTPRFVGATMKATKLRDTPPGHADDGHERTWNFAAAPETLTADDQMVFMHYRKLIFEGDLIAADLATWLSIGGRRDDFVDPKTELGKKKALALAHHAASTGLPTPASLASHWADFHGNADAAQAPGPTSLRPAPASPAVPPSSTK